MSVSHVAFRGEPFGSRPGFERKKSFIDAALSVNGLYFSGKTFVEDKFNNWVFPAYSPHIFSKNYSDENYYDLFYYYVPTFLVELRDEQLLSDFFDFVKKVFVEYGHSVDGDKVRADYYYSLWLKYNDFRLDFLSDDVRARLLSESTLLFLDYRIVDQWENILRPAICCFVDSAVENNVNSFDVEALKFLVDHVDYTVSVKSFSLLRSIVTSNYC